MIMYRYLVGLGEDGVPPGIHRGSDPLYLKNSVEENYKVVQTNKTLTNPASVISETSPRLSIRLIRDA